MEAAEDKREKEYMQLFEGLGAVKEVGKHRRSRRSMIILSRQMGGENTLRMTSLSWNASSCMIQFQRERRAFTCRRCLVYTKKIQARSFSDHENGIVALLLEEVLQLLMNNLNEHTGLNE